MSTQVFSEDRLMQVLLKPQVSEKATYIVEKNNQIIFHVMQDATKAEIRAAVELMWKSQKIEVTGVQVANVKGKEKRFGRFMGSRPNWKKAYVSIKSGQEINFSEIPQTEDK
ncbi:MAG: 50S ribosomal protein L23 [Nitrosomonadaceae bacterium]|nr:50S ribosomal protein L23 [Nitrosomonadaceae bacterium]|tara:strand:+ start:183 stop:518 length:336 start_codon:yes stop_codon:yes gene_type:complete